MREALISIQTYSVRDMWSADPVGTVARLAAYGYEGIELHDLDGTDARSFREALCMNNLKVVGAHVCADRFGEPEALADALEGLGCTNAVFPWTSLRSVPDIAQLFDTLEAAGEVLASRGIRTGYHNHSFEFEPRDDGSLIIDQLAERASLFFEADLGWIWYAGRDPLAFVERHGERCRLIHAKDLVGRPDGPNPLVTDDERFCGLGEGAVGFRRILPKISGMCESVIVEFDHSPRRDPLETAKRSLDFVHRTLGRAPTHN